MRLLGKCPECGAEDSISTHEDSLEKEWWRKVTCDQCGRKWKNRIILVSAEREKGRKLIPVEIAVNPRGATLVFPAMRDVPCVRLIMSVLNTALIVHFKGLGFCFVTEGGVEGIVDGEGIELRNNDTMLGLSDDRGFEENPVCQRLLNWYAEILRLLFEEELVVGGKNLGRGAILKLSPEDPLSEEKAKSLLYLALWKKTGSEGFAKAVFERLEQELENPISSPYIAGLTDEQIAAFFVPPPLQEVPTS